MFDLDSTPVLDLVKEYIKQRDLLIEKGFEDYLKMKYNTTKSEIEAVKGNVNNLKVKGFEKHIYPDGKECYYDKGFCFMTVYPEEVVYHYKLNEECKCQLNGN